MNIGKCSVCGDENVPLDIDDRCAICLMDKGVKLKKPEKKCCDNPDIKNEGYVDVDKGRSWEYHCYGCSKTWCEFERGK